MTEQAAPRGAEGALPGAAGSEARSEPQRVLYRCHTLTNVLCPCGAVARRLKKLGLEYRTERVPYRRALRPEIVELTGQRYVPVLVDGEEVISDSRRIRQYLDWAYGADREGTAEAGDENSSPAGPASTMSDDD